MKKMVRLIAVHTSYCLCMACLFTPSQEHHVPLRGVDVVVLQQEYSVHSIFLKRRELDKYTNRSGQSFLNDQILFASNLDINFSSVSTEL